MNYQDSALYITNQHSKAKGFSEFEGNGFAENINAGRPAGLRPFRIEPCKLCGWFHVRRGREMFVKSF